jgi:hypothetical protein
MNLPDDKPYCLDSAIDYQSRGWSVLPLCPHDHVAVGKRHHKECSSPGKVPFFPHTGSTVWGEHQTRRASADEVKGWFRSQANLNVGIALGPVSGLVAIDIDSDAGERMLEAMADGDLPVTLEYKTGNGRRLIYSLPEGAEFRIRQRKDGQKEAIRFMGAGSQIVMPPSKHKSGPVYAWVPGRAPEDIEPAVAPAWLLNVAAQAKRETEAPPTDSEYIPEGGRNNYLTRLAGAMRRQGADYETINDALSSLNSRRCDPPLPDYEVQAVAKSVCRYQPTPDMPTPTFGEATAGADGDNLPPGVFNPKSPEDVAGINDLKAAGARTEWVWKDWIQKAVLTAFAAEGGTGKTRATMDLVRRVRHRLPWPDGSDMIEWTGNTIALWVVGDNHHAEMVTLCEAFDTTDCVKINAHPADIYGGVSLENIEDLMLLEKRIAVVKPLMVVIDTVGNTTDKNLSRQEDAKAYYQPLQIIARRQNVSILCLTHLNAGGKVLGRRVMEKVRQVWRMSAETVNDHTCRRRLEVIKSNNPYPQALGVTMGEVGNEYDTNPPPSPEDREKANAGPSQATKECAEWLAEYLADKPQRVADARRDGENKGFSSKTIYDAKLYLKLVETTANKAKFWGLPGSEPPDPPTARFG